MGKFDIVFRTKCSQLSSGRIEQGICGNIIHRSEPFALEYSPQHLCNIQVGCMAEGKRGTDRASSILGEVPS